MGGILPIALSLGMGAVSTGLKYQQSKQEAQYQNQQSNLQRQMMWEQQNQEAKQQRGLLERQQAAVRASMAGRGTGAGSGSDAALLAGMSKRTEQNIADGVTMAQLRDEITMNQMDNRTNSANNGLMQGLSLAKQGLDRLR